MKKRILALTLALSLLLTACGGTSAATMHLRKTEGTVGVSDGEGKGVEPRENLSLYSGYGVDTQAESYAWIDLDSVKLAKLDQDSEIAITKEGKKLDIEVISGSLFFNVAEPLANDESMTIRTSTMAVGIRGTCGWVTQDTAALLEGTVEVTAGEQAVTISAGEMAYLTEYGELAVKSFYQEDTPAFVAEENLDGDILSEVPSLYPLVVLTKHSLYPYDDGELSDTQTQDYIYDEAGYILQSERNYYPRWGGSVQTVVATYHYDNETDQRGHSRHYVVTYSNGTTDEGFSGPGSCSMTTALNGCFADPMVIGRHDRRSEIGSDGRLEISSANFPHLAGYYAIYTMDANGYPIRIDTYSPDGVLTGTADLEWAVIDP